MEGCKIQSDMDIDGCHYQDMLLSHYILASQVTAWPLAGQCTYNLMYLENSYYNTSMIKDLDMVLSLLQPGDKEISRICGQHDARRVQDLLLKVRNLLYDTLQYVSILYQQPS